VRMPCFSRACLALFLAAIGEILAASEKQVRTVSSYRDRSKLYDFSKEEFNCLWRCEVESDLSTWLNKAFTEGNKLISFTFKFSYPKKADEQCKSVGRNAKRWNYSSWEIFLKDRELPSFVNSAIRRFSSWLEVHDGAFFNVSCNFTANLSISQHLRGELSPRACLERTLRSTAASLGQLCNTEIERKDQRTCIKISEVNRANLSTPWTILGCFFFLNTVRLYWPYIRLSLCYPRGRARWVPSNNFRRPQSCWLSKSNWKLFLFLGLHQVARGTKIHHACCYLAPSISGSSYFR